MNNFEKDIQSRLYNYEASYSPNLWDRIEKGLPQKNKKRPIFWFLLGSVLVGSGLLMLFLIEGSYFLKNNVATTSSHFKTSSATQPLTHTTKQKNGLTENNQFSNEKILVVSEKDVEPIIELQFSSRQKKNIPENKSSFNSNSNFEGLKKESDLSRYGLIEKITNSNSTNDALKFETLDSDLLLLSHDEDQNIESPECPPFGKISSSSLIAEIYYSNDFPIKSYTAKNSEFNNYQTERSRSESGLYSFSAGIRLGYISKQNYGFKTGFNYSQINEQFSYIDPDAYQSQTIITIDTIFTGGAATVVTDTSFLSIPGTLEIQNVNRYKFIDIPLLGTYEFDFGNRFYYALDFGVLFNLSFSQEGRFLNESGDLAYFTPSRSDSEIIYKSGAGMSLYGGFSILYRWKKRIDLFVSPSVKYYNKSLTTANYPLDQNYIIPALNFGARYKIK